MHNVCREVWPHSIERDREEDVKENDGSEHESTEKEEEEGEEATAVQWSISQRTQG